jgi:NAD(P)H-hydrate repair Nnr-like enzyme with NAD(P)H-hydrate epimerase domain
LEFAALIGYGLTGDPRPDVASRIERINAAQHTILALDTPSSLDVTSGVPGQPCVRATATLTLTLPKTGLLALTDHWSARANRGADDVRLSQKVGQNILMGCPKSRLEA